MNLFILSALLGFGVWMVGAHYQRKRILLLSSQLRPFQIDKLMEEITHGYLRALDKPDAERQAPIWDALNTSEARLCDQFRRFVTAFALLDAAQTRISRLPLGLPVLNDMLPHTTIDFRKLLQVHAQGLEEAAANTDGRSPKERAFVLLAELMLMQHSCHWFCRSKSIASARMVMRHQTSYAQALDAVAPTTRKAYLALVQG